LVILSGRLDDCPCWVEEKVIDNECEVLVIVCNECESAVVHDIDETCDEICAVLGSHWCVSSEVWVSEAGVVLVLNVDLRIWSKVDCSCCCQVAEIYFLHVEATIRIDLAWRISHVKVPKYYPASWPSVSCAYSHASIGWDVGVGIEDSS
jgi:hypothetical protein